MRIAITGPNGLIGSRVRELLKNDITFIPLPHSELDITVQSDVQTKLNAIDFDILLHMAAYTSVDKAEQEKDHAHSINVIGTQNIFDVVQKMNKKMIYMSTDFVFDGVNPPYDEESKPNPIGYYGMSKYKGEQVLNGSAMIVRISYPYRSDVILSGAKNLGKQDFVSRLSQFLKDGKTLTMVTDASITPTHIDDIARGLAYLIQNYKPTIYHLVGEESYSPFQVGKTIAKHIGVSTNLIQPTTFEQYSQKKAPRPQYSEIISKKNNFCKMKNFEEGLL